MKLMATLFAVALTFGCLTPGWAEPAGVNLSAHFNAAQSFAAVHATEPLSLQFLSP